MYTFSGLTLDLAGKGKICCEIQNIMLTQIFVLLFNKKIVEVKRL
jgi:hypothetical protein